MILYVVVQQVLSIIYVYLFYELRPTCWLIYELFIGQLHYKILLSILSMTLNRLIYTYLLLSVFTFND